MSQRLVCWAGEENIFVSTSITQHFHAKKALCTTFGPLKFTTLGADVCPLPDDLDVSAADPIDPVTCSPPSGTPVTSVNGQTGVVVLTAADVGAADDLLVVHLAGPETITGPKTLSAATAFGNTVALINTATWTLPNATTSAIVINRSATVDPNTSSDLAQFNYKAIRAGWFNEWGGPRVRVPTLANLGYSDVALKLFEQDAGGADGLQVFAPTDGATPSVRTRGGVLYANNILESAWTPVVVNSPQTASKYTSQVDGTAGYNSLQVRITNGGKTAEYRGRLNSVITGGVTDEIFATTPPTSIALGTLGNVSSVPLRNRGFMAQGSGGGIRINVSTTGAMQLIGTANTQPFINFDDCSYSLEL
jgi:hypothetical protein